MLVRILDSAYGRIHSVYEFQIRGAKFASEWNESYHSRHLITHRMPSAEGLFTGVVPGVTPSAAKSYSRTYWAMTYRPQDPSTIAPRGECGYGMYKLPVAAATSISTEANGAGDERIAAPWVCSARIPTRIGGPPTCSALLARTTTGNTDGQREDFGISSATRCRQRPW